jgi:hypothetical protein
LLPSHLHADGDADSVYGLGVPKRGRPRTRPEESDLVSTPVRGSFEAVHVRNNKQRDHGLSVSAPVRSLQYPLRDANGNGGHWRSGDAHECEVFSETDDWGDEPLKLSSTMSSIRTATPKGAGRRALSNHGGGARVSRGSSSGGRRSSDGGSPTDVPASSPQPPPATRLPPVPLKPFKNQVGGHSAIYKFTKRAVCKVGVCFFFTASPSSIFYIWHTHPLCSSHSLLFSSPCPSRHLC